MMNDYEEVPRRVRRNGAYRIAGQTEQLCNDIRAADLLGVSYGTYIGRKQSKAEEEYYKKYGVHMKRRRHHEQ